MLKWYERNDNNMPNIISSRIRLVRNCDHHEFPSRLNNRQSREMVKDLESGLKNLGVLDGRQYEFFALEGLNELDRKVLREHWIINSTIAKKKSPAGIIVSEDESTSLILNGSDHIRMQMLGSGLCLDSLWEKMNQLDDYVNERFSYAFDEKYGYLTSYPTNVGTGMRASVVLHLPALCTAKKFNSLIGEMARFGVTVRGLYGEESYNYGALYVVSNQKTMGITEKEIVEIVTKVAVQLNTREIQVREASLKKHRIIQEDEVYKSYGVLKYARRMSGKDAMVFLSQLMKGISDGLLETAEPCSIYRLMLGIKVGNLQKSSDRPLSKEELDMERAAYIRRELPEIKVAKGDNKI